MVATTLTDWLSQFCSWHEEFKRGALGADVLSAYIRARADLGSVLVLAQRLEIRGNSGSRQSVRVARAVPVEFDLGSGTLSLLTQDISVTGLSTLVGEAPVVGTVAPFRLRLGRDVQPIAGRCRVVANIPMRGSVRMAVAFEEIDPEGRSRIETLVFDAICSEIRVMLRSGQPRGGPESSPPAIS